MFGNKITGGTCDMLPRWTCSFLPFTSKRRGPPFSTQPAKAMGRHSHEFTTKSWLLPCTVTMLETSAKTTEKKHSSFPTCPPWFDHGFPIFFLFGGFWSPAIDPRCQVGLDHPICYLFPRRSGQTPRQWRSLAVISIGWGRVLNSKAFQIDWKFNIHVMSREQHYFQTFFKWTPTNGICTVATVQCKRYSLFFNINQ